MPLETVISCEFDKTIIPVRFAQIGDKYYEKKTTIYY
jgi:hypothetical protein